MAIKKKNLEILWQDFEKSGSVEAYLHYHNNKNIQASKKKEARPKVGAKSKR